MRAPDGRRRAHHGGHGAPERAAQRAGDVVGPVVRSGHGQPIDPFHGAVMSAIGVVGVGGGADDWHSLHGYNKDGRRRVVGNRGCSDVLLFVWLRTPGDTAWSQYTYMYVCGRHF